MHIKLAAIVVSTLFISSMTWAAPINNFINQALSVNNYTTATVLVTDKTVSGIQAEPLLANFDTIYTYPSDQFTVASGQTFSHTILITNLKSEPICTVTSHLNISLTSESLSHPTSSNEARCSTSVYQSFDADGKIYGFKIDVH